MFGKKKKQASKPKNSITLSPAETETLKQLELAIKEHERALDSTRKFFASLLTERYGVDLEKDTWTLDLDAGTLVKEP